MSNFWTDLSRHHRASRAAFTGNHCQLRTTNQSQKYSRIQTIVELMWPNDKNGVNKVAYSICGMPWIFVREKFYTRRTIKNSILGAMHITQSYPMQCTQLVASVTVCFASNGQKSSCMMQELMDDASGSLGRGWSNARTGYAQKNRVLRFSCWNHDQINILDYCVMAS